MTTNEAKSNIGRSALWKTTAGRVQVKVPVVVKDHRSQFGRDDYLVWPVGGSGEGWVSGEALEWSEEN